MPQRPQARREFPPAEVLANLVGGLDTYTNPTQAPWQRWLAGNNVFGGAFGFVQRARWANIVFPVTASIATIAQAGTATITVTLNAPGISNLRVGDLINILGNSNPTWGNIGNVQIGAVLSPTQFTFGGSIATNTGTGGTATYASVVGSGTVNNWLPQSTIFSTLKYYALPGLSSYLIADANGKLFSFDAGNSYASIQRFNPYIDSTGVGSVSLAGPWSREVLQNILYEMNGTVKQSGRGANASTVEGFGLDTPDSSPQVVLSAGASQTITNIQRTNGTVTVTLGAALTVPGGNGIGMVNVTVSVGDVSFAGTFVVLTGSGTTTLTWTQLGNNTALLTPTGTVNTNITKSIGRSYAWAWENANKPHVGAPSPSTQFILYSSQNGVIQLVQQGTVTTTGASAIVTGTGTAFTQAWVGRSLYINGGGNTILGARIVSVQSSTQLTLFGVPGAVSGAQFQVFDPQATHVRLYASADGGATYFRVQRNAVVSLAIGGSLVLSGLQFFDNANAEPPNFPFTSEISQLYNIPPPIGAAMAMYQGRLIVFQVTGARQSFFYSNSELTSIGMPQESFAPLNQYTLPIANASLAGWQEMPGSAIFWSDRQDMFRLTGLLTDNTAASPPTLGAQVSRLPYNLGIVNPRAVDITPLGAIWVTPQFEVWLYTDRYAPRNIGRPIQGILNTINAAQSSQIEVKYYHNNTRNWLVIAAPINGQANNNTLLILDLDLLASNGSPSFFVFDMATNQPSWYQYSVACPSIEVMYEPNGNVRLLTGATDLVQDVDFGTGFGTEIAVPNASFLTHAWGNDTAVVIKRPTWLRFNTNRDPTSLASDGWTFQALGIDDDFYTFAFPLTLTLTPGVNDTVVLGGNTATSLGSPFRTSPELFRVGAVNFVMGRRIQFQVNFPATAGVNYQFRQIQLGFGPSPPR